jgi:hypothetical protein
MLAASPELTLSAATSFAGASAVYSETLLKPDEQTKETLNLTLFDEYGYSLFYPRGEFIRKVLKEEIEPRAMTLFQPRANLSANLPLCVK